MVEVKGYWKVQLVCLILLTVIAVAIMGFGGNENNQEVGETFAPINADINEA